VISDVGSVWEDAGIDRWYVDSDLVTAFCRLVCGNIDFQQLNGRILGVMAVIALTS
jgi:hypothetical protein